MRIIWTVAQINYESVEKIFTLFLISFKKINFIDFIQPFMLVYMQVTILYFHQTMLKNMTINTIGTHLDHWDKISFESYKS